MIPTLKIQIEKFRMADKKLKIGLPSSFLFWELPNEPQRRCLTSSFCENEARKASNKGTSKQKSQILAMKKV